MVSKLLEGKGGKEGGREGERKEGREGGRDGGKEGGREGGRRVNLEEKRFGALCFRYYTFGVFLSFSHLSLPPFLPPSLLPPSLSLSLPPFS